MPEVSALKRIQLALGCCIGNRPLPIEGKSHYRHRKFRDSCLAFVTSTKFHSDPFDPKGLWLQDLEDCENLFDAQAIMGLLASAVKKRHLRLNRTTPNDKIITLAEFCRRLLFDPESKQDAVEVLQHCILAMKSNGISNYTQLFHPQEINLIIGC